MDVGDQYGLRRHLPSHSRRRDREGETAALIAIKRRGEPVSSAAPGLPSIMVVVVVVVMVMVMVMMIVVMVMMMIILCEFHRMLNGLGV